MCTAPDVPSHIRPEIEQLGYDPDRLAMVYVHKDEHIALERVRAPLEAESD